MGLTESTVAIVFQNYSFNTALFMLFLDFFIFLLLGLYLDKILAFGFGYRLNPFFPCMPSYYKSCCCKNSVTKGSRYLYSEHNDTLEEDDDKFERM